MYESTKAEREKQKELGRRNAKEFWNIVRAKLIERDAKAIGDGLRDTFAIPPSAAEAKMLAGNEQSAKRAREPGEGG